jgi:hypothetical protein
MPIATSRTTRDNRQINLRVVTHAEQQRNKAPRTGGTSVHVGVSAVGDRWKGFCRRTHDEGMDVTAEVSR